MTTINQVGVGLSGASGTGAFVGSTSPTITTPKIGQINDASGNVNLLLSSIGSAVNYLNIFNNATGASPTLNALGSDTNVGLTFAAKGTGPFLLQTTALTNQFTFYTGTALAHQTIFNFPATTASQTVTFPDASGTIAIPQTGTFAPVLTGSGGGSATYVTQQANYTVIGNRVLFDIYIVISGSSLVNNITITGLPFTAASQNFAIAIWVNSLAVTSITQVEALVNAGTAVISLYKYSAGSATAISSSDLGTSASLALTGQYFV